MFNFSNDRGRVKVTIDSLQLIGVDGYHDQYLRPYNTTMTGKVHEAVMGMVNDFDGKVPVGRIADTTRNFIMPAAAPEQYRKRNLPVSIANGWNDTRFTFTMTVTTTIDGIESKELVTGYTDRIDTSRSQYGDEIHIAPDTVFYINSITLIKTRRVGSNIIPIVSDSYSVYGGGLGKSGYDNANVIKMTPQNIVKSSEVRQYSDISDIPTGTYVAADPRFISGLPALSSRKNNSPSHYLTKIISSHTQATKQRNRMGLDDHVDIISAVRGAVADRSVSETGFMYLLSIQNGIRGYSSTFTYGQLTDLDSEVDKYTDVAFTEYTTTQYSAPWDSPTIEAQNATIIASMVTNLMLNYSLTQLVFSSTNMISSRSYLPSSTQNITRVDFVHGYSSNIDYRGYNAELENVIDTELIPVISSSGEMGYDISVKASINNDIEITITMDGSPDHDVLFVFPSFADSATSPVLTSNTDTYKRVATDIGEIMDAITDNIFKENVDSEGSNISTTNLYGDVNATMSGGMFS